MSRIAFFLLSLLVLAPSFAQAADPARMEHVFRKKIEICIAWGGCDEDGNPVPLPGAPSISALADRSVIRGTSLGAVAFTIGDENVAPGLLSVSAASSNSAVLAGSSIGISCVLEHCTLSTDVLASSGQTRITVEVSNGNRSTSSGFWLTVLDSGNPPDIRPDLPDVSVSLYSYPPLIIPFTIQDLDSHPSGFSASAVLSDPAIATASVSGSGESWTLSLSPDAPGDTTVTLTALDAPGGLSASKSFNLRVLDFLEATPGAPAISEFADVSVRVGEALTIPYFVADAEDGADVLVHDVMAENPALLDGISSEQQDGMTSAFARQLSLTAGAVPGTTRITASVTDTDGNATSEDFLLTVLPSAGLPPQFAHGVDDKVYGVGDGEIFPVAATDPDSPASEMSLSAASSVPSVVSPVVTKTADGLWDLELVGLAPGTSTITLKVQTGDGSDGQWSALSFHVLVLSMPPVIEPVAAVSLVPGVSEMVVLDIHDDVTPVSLLRVGAWDGAVVSAGEPSFVAGSWVLPVMALGSGDETITVFARDAEGQEGDREISFLVAASSDFPPAIAPHPPTQEMQIGEDRNISVALSDLESLPAELGFSAISSAPEIVAVSVSGAGTSWSMALDAVGTGSATITMTATDSLGQTAVVSFGVNVHVDAPPPQAEAENTPPVIISSHPGLAPRCCGNDVRQVLRATDAESPPYLMKAQVASSNPGVVAVSLENGTPETMDGTWPVLISPVAAGSATITLRVLDTPEPEGLWTQESFTVSVVPGDYPQISDISDRVVFPGVIAEVAFTVAHDVYDGGDLTLSAVSAHPAIVPEDVYVEHAGGQAFRLYVEPDPAVSSGYADITVSAFDPDSRHDEKTFRVKLFGTQAGTNLPPEIVPVIETQTMGVSAPAQAYGLSVYDQDSDPAEFTTWAKSSNPGVATVSKSGSGAHYSLLVTPVSAGETTISFGVRDEPGPEGFDVATAFRLTILGGSDGDAVVPPNQTGGCQPPVITGFKYEDDNQNAWCTSEGGPVYCPGCAGFWEGHGHDCGQRYFGYDYFVPNIGVTYRAIPEDKHHSFFDNPYDWERYMSYDPHLGSSECLVAEGGGGCSVRAYVWGTKTMWGYPTATPFDEMEGSPCRYEDTSNGGPVVPLLVKICSMCGCDILTDDLHEPAVLKPAAAPYSFQISKPVLPREDCHVQSDYSIYEVDGLRVSVTGPVSNIRLNDDITRPEKCLIDTVYEGGQKKCRAQCKFFSSPQPSCEEKKTVSVKVKKWDVSRIIDLPFDCP